MSKEEREDISSEIKKLNERMDSIENKLDPVVEALRTAGSLKKGMIWISAFLLSLTAIIGCLKALVAWFNKI